MNTEHSGESSSEHSLDSFIRPIGNPSQRDPSISDDDRSSQSGPAGDLRADQTHRDDISKPSSQNPHAHASSSSTDQSSVASDNSAFVFRVDCPGSPPQRLQLTGEIYTLGTADGCSIRLRDSNVLPLHATIRHTANSVFVESHSQPLVINGQTYQSRELKNGDILSLGGYRFELVSNQRVQSAANECATLTNVLPPDVERALARSTNPREHEESTDQNNLQDLVTQSRLDACLRREKLCEKREAKLADDIAELKYREEDLLKRISRLEAEEASSLEIYDQLSKRQTEINSLRSSLQETQSLNLKRETELQKAKGELERQLAECLEESEAVLGKYDSDSRRIELLNSQIEELNAALNDAQQQRDLLELREQLQRREHEQLVRQLEKDRDEVIAEKARNQAQLRKMEGNIRDLESLVASANDLDPSPHEDNSTPDLVADQSTTDDNHVESPSQQASDANRPTPIPVLDFNQSALEQLDPNTLEEFTELSQRNASLLAELMELKRDRDRTKTQVTPDPSNQVSDLEEALSSASSELAKTREDYKEAMSLLEKMERQKELQRENRSHRSARSRDDHDDSDPGMGALQSTGGNDSNKSATNSNSEESPSETTTSWNSLLGKLRRSSLADATDQRDQATETTPSPGTNEAAPSTSQHHASAAKLVEADTEESGWFQTKRHERVETLQTKQAGVQSVAPSRSGSQISTSAGTDDDLFITGSHLAVAKSTRVDSSNDSNGEAMIWNGGRREPLTPTSNSEKAVEHSPASDDAILFEAVEEAAQETCVGDSRVETKQAADRITARLTHSIRTLFFSEGDAADHQTTSDQAIITRYAFAFAAVMAGLVCYRLVPGQVRYIAVLMALVLAAIYTTEGVTLAKSRAAR